MKAVFSTLKKILSAQIRVWVIVLTLILLVVGFIFGYSKGLFTSSTDNVQSSSVVRYVKKAEEVVFLNAGIQTVVSQEENTKLFGKFTVPASRKKALVVINYQAKFGIKSAPKIKKTAEHDYQITLPKYQVIGFELAKKNRYKLYDTSGDILSFSTKNIDTGHLVTKELDEKKQEKYLASYKDMITSSAKDYYTKLLTTVDPDIKLSFKTTD